MRRLIMLLILLSSAVFGLEVKGYLEMGNSSAVSMIDGTSKVVIAYENSDTDINGVKIVDYSDPTNLKIIGTYDVNKSSVNDIKIVGDIMYVTTSNGINGSTPNNTQFDVVDISDTFNPKLIKRVSVYQNGFISGVKVAISHDKTKLAVSTYYKTKIYDITDPKNPVEKVDLSSVDNSADSSAMYALSFSVDDKYIFTVNDLNYDSAIYNIENLSDVKLTDKFRTVGWVSTLVQSKDGSKVIISDTWNKYLNIYDFNNGLLSNEQNISLGSSNEPQDMVMTKDGKYIYIAVGGNQDHPGVMVYDVPNQTIAEDINLSDSGWFATRGIALSEDETTLVVTTDINTYIVDTGRSISTNTDDFSITIKPGWNLLGATTDMDISIFPDSIKSIWRYENGNWLLHINSALQNITTDNFGFTNLTHISKGQGFWVYNETSDDVIIDSNSTTNDVNGSKKDSEK